MKNFSASILNGKRKTFKARFIVTSHVLKNIRIFLKLTIGKINFRI